MTIEESKTRWQLEKQRTDYSKLSDEMRQLYDVVDGLIEAGTITYDDFVTDVLDAMTTNIVSNGKENKDPDRHEQVKAMCLGLIDKYTKKHEETID